MAVSPTPRDLRLARSSQMSQTSRVNKGCDDCTSWAVLLGKVSSGCHVFVGHPRRGVASAGGIEIRELGLCADSGGTLQNFSSESPIARRKLRGSGMISRRCPTKPSERTFVRMNSAGNSYKPDASGSPAPPASPDTLVGSPRFGVIARFSRRRHTSAGCKGTRCRCPSPGPGTPSAAAAS